MGAMSNLNIDFIKSTTGLILLAEIVLSGIGGILAVALSSSGFFSFVFWSTVCISGLILALYVLNMMPAIEAKFPLMSKVRLGYTLVWTGFYLICSIISFISFSLSAVLVYVCTFIFVVDLIVRYRAYKSAGPDATASNPAAAAASGGEVGQPKY